MNFQIGKVYTVKGNTIYRDYIFIHSSTPCGSGIFKVVYSILGTNITKADYTDPNIWEEV